MYVIITDQEQPRTSGDIIFPIMGIFLDVQGQSSNSSVGGPIRPKFELVQALMHVIVTCKYEKDQMKKSQEKVETPFDPL